MRNDNFATTEKFYACGIFFVPREPIICEGDRNGAGTQEVQEGFGPGRYDNQFLIPLATLVTTLGTKKSDTQNYWHRLRCNAPISIRGIC